MKELKQYSTITDKFESLYTIVVYSTTLENFITTLFEKLKSIKNRKDPYKRKYHNDRIYSLINYFGNQDREKIINKVYLLGKDIEEFSLTKNHIKTLLTYNVRNINIINGTNFAIDYVIDLLTDVIFYHVISVKNNDFDHYILNSTKRKIVHQGNLKEKSLVNYIANSSCFNNKCIFANSSCFNNKCIIHGVSSHLKNLKLPFHTVVKKHLSDCKILELIDSKKMEEKHKKLQEYFSYINNEKMEHLIVFGKNIQKAIKNYALKEIYCIPDMCDKIKSKIPPEYLNFDIIEIKSLKKGDSGDILRKDYKGIIGIKYY